MKTPFLITIAATAGFAVANPISLDDATRVTQTNAGTPNVTYTVDISGYQFNDSQGSLNNETLSILFGNNQLITGIGWDVNLSTIGASWASEATMFFHTDFNPSSDFNLNVADDSAPVSNQQYQSDILDLTDSGLSNIGFGPGLWELEIEFFESFIDNAGTGDAFFEQGSVLRLAVFEMPAPGPLSVLGLGGLFAARRRR